MAKEPTVSESTEETGEMSDEAFEDVLFGEDDAEDEEQPEGDEAEADEAPEEDVDEAEEDDAEDEEPEEEPEPEAPAPVAMDATVEWVTRDGTQKATVEELVKGHLMHRDYTQKTQEIAETKRQLQDTLAQWAVPQEEEPNWQWLAANNPQGYIQAQAEWQQKLKIRDQARQQWHALQEEQNEAERQAQAQELERARDTLLEQIPELKDAKQRQVVTAGMQKAAGFLGYDLQELEGITDPRIYRGLHLVAQVLDMQEKQPALTKKVAATSKTLPTSARSGKALPGAKAKKARAALKATGGDDDDVFAEFLFS